MRATARMELAEWPMGEPRKVNTEQAAIELAGDIAWSAELSGDVWVTYHDCKDFLEARGIDSAISQATIIRVAGLKGYIVFMGTRIRAA